VKSPGPSRGRLVAALLVLLAGCAGTTARHASPLRFPEDVFAFANETVWEYHVDPASGRSWWHERDPRPPFSLRCGPMARGVRQFWAHARFDPSQPAAEEATYERLVRRVMDADPRRTAEERIVIPGYADLRAFSAAYPELVKRNVAGLWTSQLQRGNWRMIFPFTAGHQARTAARLREGLARGWPPIVHLLRFPQLTLNHMVVVYAVDETPAELRFRAYDPNDAEAPVDLVYDRVARTFSFASTPYFPGGPVKAYAIYDGPLY